MTTSHTPGNWFKDAHMIVNNTGDLIAACSYQQGASTQANANLIAAAPELLAACVLALDCATNPGGDLQARAKQVRETLSAAIGKATDAP